MKKKQKNLFFEKIEITAAIKNLIIKIKIFKK
jgi:hypothetical protein